MSSSSPYEIEYETTEELVEVEVRKHSTVGEEIEPEPLNLNYRTVMNKILPNMRQSSRTTRSTTVSGVSGSGSANGNPQSRNSTPDPSIADSQFIFKFIRKVKSMPLLYNHDDKNFRNVNLKQKGWRIIAQEFGQDAKWCMKKWVSLRDYYVKRKKLLRGGQAAKPWIYYNELKFLNVNYGHDRLDFYPTDRETEAGRNKYDESDYSLSEKVQFPSKTTVRRVKLTPEEINQEEQQYEYEQEYEQEQEEELEIEVASEHEDGDGDGDGLNACTPVTNGNNNKRKKIDNSATVSTPNNNRIEKHGQDVDNWDINCIEQDNSGESQLNESSSYSLPQQNSHDTYDLFCLSVAALMKDMSRDKALALQVKIMTLMYEMEFPDNSR